MPTFYETFMDFPVAERQRIADEAGLSLPYIAKHMYVSGRDPKFHFANAVAMDKASNGSLSFLMTTEGVIDWGHVRRTTYRLWRVGQCA